MLCESGLDKLKCILKITGEPQKKDTTNILREEFKLYHINY